jgi:hypothetical protein
MTKAGDNINTKPWTGCVMRNQPNISIKWQLIAVCRWKDHEEGEEKTASAK